MVPVFLVLLYQKLKFNNGQVFHRELKQPALATYFVEQEAEGIKIKLEIKDCVLKCSVDFLSS